jgi:hypothetical protein
MSQFPWIRLSIRCCCQMMRRFIAAVANTAPAGNCAGAMSGKASDKIIAAVMKDAHANPATMWTVCPEALVRAVGAIGSARFAAAVRTIFCMAIVARRHIGCEQDAGKSGCQQHDDRPVQHDSTFQ